MTGDQGGLGLPQRAGVYTRQAHADLPDGTFERELGREGFYGPATHMLHRHPPTGWSDWLGPLRPRAFDLSRLDAAAATPLAAPVVLANPHVQMRVWRQQGAMDHLARDADGDLLLFVHAGSGALFCDWGHLEIGEGDYVLLPRSTLWRLEAAEPLFLLMIEATGGGFRLPDKGIAGRHAVFDPAALDLPALDDAFLAQQDESEWLVRIKRRDQLSTVTFPFNPLDAVGWHGDLLPVRLNWRAIRPLMSHRAHVPPSAHTTFVAERFVVCTFVPRPLESDPGALKVPFFHSNNDYDEVLFYHAGNFVSRDGIHPGMMTLHPAGFPHGPHPKALRASRLGTRTATDEVAVMVDARDALDPGEAMAEVEWPGYVESWKESPG